ncbi:nitroreductase [uncultured Halopseudomonas sp.]|uniref:nitroreductase n=1 Tax=uncultured Halopseudomonas sp. TaxID=2901193 RepID=UPI0030EDA36B|tara:strand:- start:33418 stop:34101 length:684 start_codon:yes stop_codon:yes gene_type:complete
MSVIELLKKRISTRAFLDSPVEQDTVRALLDAARWSPSGGNVQPWKVIVVSGEARSEVTKRATAALARNPQGEAGDYPIYPEGLHEPYRSRRFQMGEDMYAIMGIAREDKAKRFQALARNFEFFGAPVGIFMVIDRAMGHGQWAHMGMFMQSLALAAEEMGLATCMQEAWAMVRDTLHEHFELPSNEMLYCGIALGCADREAPVNGLRTRRATVGEFADFRGFQRED